MSSGSHETPSWDHSRPPLPRLSLRRNFVWTVAGTLTYNLCQWGILVVLAKLGSPEMVGKFTFGLAFCAPVIMLSNFGLEGGQATDARGEYYFGHYMGLRLVTAALALLIIVAIVGMVKSFREEAYIILAVGLAKVIESFSAVFYGLFLKYEMMDRLAISQMIKGPLSLLALGMGVYLTGDLLWGAFGLVLAWSVILIGYDARVGIWIRQTLLKAPHDSMFGDPDPTQGIRPLWNLRKLKSLAWIGMPLGLGAMLISLNTNIPRYLIEQYLGMRELGIFAALAYLVVGGRMVIGAMGTTATPRLAKYYAEGNRGKFLSLLVKLLGIGLILGILGVAMVLMVGREILTLIYRPEYAEHTDVLMWLMVGGGISYIGLFLGCGMTGARYFAIQLPLYLLVTLFTALASFWLIPLAGLKGAAVAFMLAMIIQSGAILLIMVHVLKNMPVNQESDKLESCILTPDLK